MRNIGKRKQWQWQWLGLEQDLNYGAQWETGALRWHYISGKHWHYSGTRHNWNWRKIGKRWETVASTDKGWVIFLVKTGKMKTGGEMGNWGSNKLLVRNLGTGGTGGAVYFEFIFCVTCVIVCVEIQLTSTNTVFLFSLFVVTGFVFGFVAGFVGFVTGGGVVSRGLVVAVPVAV